MQVAELKSGSQILIGDNIFKIDFKTQSEKVVPPSMFTPVRANPVTLRNDSKSDAKVVASSNFDNFKPKTAQTKSRLSTVGTENSTAYGSLFMPMIVILVLLGIVWFYKNDFEISREPAASKDESLRESIEGTTKEISRIEQSQKTKSQLPIQQEYARQHYQKGFRDYRLGQYDRALQSFQAALSFDTGHKLARKYWDLSKRKLDEKIQGFLVGSRDHLQRGNFKLCLSTAKSVMNMIKDQSDNRYKEASQIQSYCEERIGEVQ